MPRISEVIIVKNRVKKRFPPAMSTRPLAIFRPIPVRVTTPTMIPAVAQAMATPSAPRAPAWRAVMMSQGLIRVAFVIIPATIERPRPTRAA